MLLEKLREYSYSDEMELPPPLYDEVAVRYLVDLNGDGRLLNPQLTDTSVPDDRRQRNGRAMAVPQIQRSSGLRALLFADNAEYTFGVARESSRPERVAEAHAAYIEVLQQCVTRTEDAGAATVLRFLRNDPQAQLQLSDDFDAGARITFRVDGRFVATSPEVQAFWLEWNQDSTAQQMQCVVCGDTRPVLERLQAKVKGVPGGQTAGTSLISANAPAFESYGLEASLIAPTCPECGERVTKALNALIGNERRSYRLGGSVFVFWTAQPTEFDFKTLIDQPDPQDVAALIDSLYSGHLGPALDPTPFYATVLSGSGGRTVVRDWIDTTVGSAQERVARWHQAQRIVDEWGREGRPLGLYPLAGATVRRSADLPMHTLRAMVRAALTGTQLPLDLLFHAVRRARVERDVTYARAALIKLVLLSRDEAGRFGDEEALMDLAHGADTPAYHCGRLMAVIEEAQRQAIAGVRSGAGASVVDRYFSKASTVPSMVFGPLLADAQAHLSKLERDNRGAYFGLQQRLEEVLGHITDGFPRTLRPEQQGEFVLGYYHQRAANRAAALERRERRDAVGGDQPGDTDEI